jgi:ribosome maturation factor RimP
MIRLTFEVGAAPTFFIGHRLRTGSAAIPQPEQRTKGDPLKLDPRISEIVEGVAAREGLELVHAELAGGRTSILRILIDKPGGVTLEDCARMSERLSVVLDVEDPIPGAYTLEVASPGLDRGLYKAADYERFAGLPCHARLREPIEGQRNFHGRLVGLDSTGEPAAVIEDETGRRQRLPLTAILKAHVEIEPREMP